MSYTTTDAPTIESAAVPRRLVLESLGGGLGMLDLRLPFLAALMVAVGQLAITWKMDEPPRDPGHVSSGWRHDVAAVATHLRTRTLAWITLYVVAEVVLIHLASEFASPFAATVLDRPVDDPAGAAVVAGVVVAASALVGALVVRFFVPMQQRIGTLGVLVGAGFVSASIVGLMATEIALWVLPFLALRGAQASVTAVAVPAGEQGNHGAEDRDQAATNDRIEHAVAHARAYQDEDEHGRDRES